MAQPTTSPLQLAVVGTEDSAIERIETVLDQSARDTAFEAIRTLDALEPDLKSADCVLVLTPFSESDVEAVLRAIHDHQPQTPRVVLSSSGDPSLEARALAADARAHRLAVFETDPALLGDWLDSAVNPVQQCETDAIGCLDEQPETTASRQRARLEEVAGVISHDLQNPFTVAVGNLDLARETGEESYLDSVEIALDRIDALAEDLLVVAREGQTVESAQSVSLEAVVRRAWHSITDERSRLRTAFEPGTVLRADKDRLLILFGTLMENAIDHSAEPVTVTVEPTASKLAIRDSGPGIDAEHRENVFEPGYSTMQGRNGMGLTMARATAQAHGWEIELRETDSKGTQFDVTGVSFGSESSTDD